MNSLPARIKTIDTSEGISLVTLELDAENSVQSIILETPNSADYLSIGNELQILFKETEVSLITNEDIRISTKNIIKGHVETIEAGELLCTVTMRISCGSISAIVVREALENMQLSPGDAVKAIVKTNEIMLSA